MKNETTLNGSHVSTLIATLKNSQYLPNKFPQLKIASLGINPEQCRALKEIFSNLSKIAARYCKTLSPFLFFTGNLLLNCFFLFLMVKIIKIIIKNVQKRTSVQNGTIVNNSNNNPHTPALTHQKPGHPQSQHAPLALTYDDKSEDQKSFSEKNKQNKANLPNQTSSGTEIDKKLGISQKFNNKQSSKKGYFKQKANFAKASKASTKVFLSLLGITQGKNASHQKGHNRCAPGYGSNTSLGKTGTRHPQNPFQSKINGFSRGYTCGRDMLEMGGLKNNKTSNKGPVQFSRNNCIELETNSLEENEIDIETFLSILNTSKEGTSIYEEAKKLYNKPFSSYEDIAFLDEGEIKHLKDLSQKEIIDILKKCARGKDIPAVEKLENDISQREVTQDEFKARVSALLGIHDQETSTCHDLNHAMRASMLAVAISSLYRNLFKEFSDCTNDSGSSQKQSTAIDAGLSALFHDCGRQSEGIDIYDDMSADYADKILTKFDNLVDQSNRSLVVSAMKAKDDPVCARNGDVIKDTAAVILHEADCLEYMRLEKYGVPFDVTYLDVFAKDYTEENPSFKFTLRDGITPEQAHVKLMALVSKVRQFIQLTDSRNDLSLDDYKNIANTIHLFGKDMSFIKYAHKPYNEPPCTENFTKFGLDETKNFISQNDLSELFRYKNAFEISQNFLKYSENEDVKKIIAGKGYDINHVNTVMLSCQALKNDGWHEDFARQVTFHRLQMAENKIFPEELSKSGDEAVLNRTAEYISSHGGSWALVETMIFSQIASSWSEMSVALKEWIHNQRANTDDNWGSFFPDTRSQDGATTIAKVRHSKLSLFANFKRSRDHGGRAGRKALLKKFASQPESSWLKIMSKVVGRKSAIQAPSEKFKEQIGIDKARKLANEVRELADKSVGPVFAGSFGTFQKKWQKLCDLVEKISRRRQKVEYRLNFVQGAWKTKAEPVINNLAQIEHKVNDINSENFDGQKLDEVQNLLSGTKTNVDQMCTKRMMREARFYVADNMSTMLDPTSGNENSSMFDKTFIMFYAAGQEALFRTALPGKDAQNQSITLYRRCDDAYMDNCFQANGNNNCQDRRISKVERGMMGTLRGVAAYDSFAPEILPWNVLGNHALEISTPLHRIWWPYFFFSSLMGDNLNNGTDYRNEFAVMADGCQVKYLGDPDSINMEITTSCNPAEIKFGEDFTATLDPRSDLSLSISRPKKHHITYDASVNSTSISMQNDETRSR